MPGLNLGLGLGLGPTGGAIAPSPNMFSNPQTFSAGVWSKLNAVITSNSTTAPDGTLTADTIADNNAGGTGNVQIYQGVTLAINTMYTFSVHVKEKQLPWVVLRALNYTMPANSEAWFNANTGLAGTIDPGFEASGIEAAAEGFVRPWVQFMTGGADVTGDLRILVADEDNNTPVARDGTSDLFIWGAKLEVGGLTGYVPE